MRLVRHLLELISGNMVCETQNYSLFTSEVMNAVDNHIYDLLSGKISAIRLATESASTILKVDQVSNICFFE